MAARFHGSSAFVVAQSSLVIVLEPARASPRRGASSVGWSQVVAAGGTACRVDGTRRATAVACHRCRTVQDWSGLVQAGATLGWRGGWRSDGSRAPRGVVIVSGCAAPRAWIGYRW